MKFKKYLEKLQKYQYNITYGLDYLFNKINEENYYEPAEIKTAFDGGYTLYESRKDKDAKLSIDEYLDKIRPYLKDVINNHKAIGEWKIQLIMRIIFVSFTDATETRAMHTKSDNIVIMSGTETDDIINELFKSFSRRYQEGLETKMKGNNFTFEHIDLWEYHLHKISLNRGSSYIDSPEWIKNKRVTINLKKVCHYTGKYRGAAHSKCNLNYRILKEIPVIFHNGSAYDYHFIIRHLAKEFIGSFDSLGEKTKKYITFSVPIKKKHDNGKTFTYKPKLIDSYRFMSDSLSNIVDNLSEINNNLKIT